MELPYEPETQEDIDEENRVVRARLEDVVRRRTTPPVEFVNPWGNGIPYDEEAEQEMVRSISPESVGDPFSDNEYDDQAELQMIRRMVGSPTSVTETSDLGDLDLFDPLNF